MLLGLCRPILSATIALYETESINDSTYLLVNHDKYVEYPFIYVKLFEDISLAMVIDTGCGAHNGVNGTPTVELKDYIDGNIIPESLETSKDEWEYLVFCTRRCNCYTSSKSGAASQHIIY